MHQINEQSPSKTTSTCFQCHQLGHWASDCPQSPNFRTPSTINRSPISVFPSSSSDYPPTHCRCGAGFCEIRVSNSEKNPNREYYCCPGKFEYYCNYFKWCDNLKKEEILEVQPKPFPVCACGAGVCSVKVEESGANAGRSCFVCPIKKVKFFIKLKS
ncbi:DNA topoisomerase 3-alpha [Bienertia sinuspersici]